MYRKKMNISSVRELCCGCTACSSRCPQNCIHMEYSDDGFIYPVVDMDKCIGCEVCLKTCPVADCGKKVISNKYPKFYAGRSRDVTTVMNSSSGGMFSELAKVVLDNKGVVFGAAFDLNFNVKHIWIDNENDLRRLQGSKYTQSDLGDTFREAKTFLEQGRHVLFSGTPCQVSGFKKFLGKEYEKLLLVDFICHGVPTPKLWRKYVDDLSNRYHGKVTTASFRSKKTGYTQFSLLLSFDNRREYCRKVQSDPYMRMFLQDCFLRNSCFSCKFKTLQKESDITLSDFWEVGHFFPDWDDDRGISLLYVNSERGESNLHMVLDRIEIISITEEQALYKNNTVLHTASRPKKRDYAISHINDFSINKLIKISCVPLWREKYRRMKYKLSH